MYGSGSLIWGTMGLASAAASEMISPSGGGGAGTAKLSELNRELRLMGDRLDKLVLVNMAMWSLLQERAGVTEEQLIKKMEEIDLQDGVADGKVTHDNQNCGNCGRTISQRHRRCLFCGSGDLGKGAFNGV